ncbi:hypothetical protein [uncultured Reyranella sp.]|uniref:hypothetical protein n=1 Tax=uncultured Reyranella sp. TaxID=735512 RepID=UPI0025E3A1CF|nr:hypothetical protein [uncultured Reyranella sp.]
MTEAERLRTEIRDRERRLRAPKQRRDHTSRDKPAATGETPAETMDRKLDSALSDSFPGSDAVSFLQPTPDKPTGLR